MHAIEPYYAWRNYYIAAEDYRSPFFETFNSETEFTDAIYNHVIHPQWDNIESGTLFIKLLFADYDDGYAIIETIGEWNDTLYNDIMTLKRNIIDVLVDEGITKFIVIGENILNFHSSDDSYYEEWFDDIEDGWITFLNFREHVIADFKAESIDSYILMDGKFNDIDWRTKTPMALYSHINKMVEARLIG